MQRLEVVRPQAVAAPVETMKLSAVAGLRAVVRPLAAADPRTHRTRLEDERICSCSPGNDDAGNGVHGSPSDYLAQQQAFADSTIELLKAFP